MNTFSRLSLLLLVLALFTLTTGCGGCDDVAGTQHGADQDTGLNDTGDAFVPDVPTDVLEVDAHVDAASPDAGDCVDGAIRQCGTDVGECEFGEQVCQGGQWGPCEGGVEPQPETCSGLDESCSGVADDEETLCELDLCAGAGQCVAGECVFGEPVDCSHLDEPCMVGTCDAKFGGCMQVRALEGSSCDDDNFCTVDGVCALGVCEGLPRDCSEAADQCNQGVCDSEQGACVASPISDGEDCDDGLFCTVNTACSAGQCVGTNRSCAGLGDQCNDVVCNEDDGICEVIPRANGTSCDNGLYCTTLDTCQEGVCTAGPTRSCNAQGGACRTGECDEQARACTGEPLPNGTPCDDGLFCTVGNQCQAGECVVSTPRDCSHEANQCNTGICDEANNRCAAAPVINGTSCNDQRYCTVNDSCTDGECTGRPRNCAGAGDQCNAGVCDENAGSCVAQPYVDNRNCDDGLFCTVNTTCTAGQCTGQARNCSGLDRTCEYGVCDENAGSCVRENAPNGESCDDGLFCTVNDACSSGTCLGSPRSCAHLDGDCSEGTCSENGGECRAVNTCGDCQMLPTADAGANLEVSPNTLVTLDGTDSSDPQNLPLTYDWRIESRPLGSSASLNNPGTATPTILADVAGDFVICVMVTNQNNCESAESCMTLTVKPQASLHIELVWLTNNPVDFDLHYRAPGGTWFSKINHPPPRSTCSTAQQADSAWWCVPNPDWGGGAGGEPDGDPANDPYLDVDNTCGDGPENINQDVLFDGQGFRIGVHFYSDYSFGPQQARIRVYVNGDLEFEETHTISCRQFWEVAEINVSDNATTVTITSLNRQTLQTNLGNCDSTGLNQLCPQ